MIQALFNKFKSKKVVVPNFIPDFWPHKMNVETKENAEKIASYQLVGQNVRRNDFSIESLQMHKYLYGLIEGDPNSAVYGEMVLPILLRCKGTKTEDQVKQAMTGVHFIIPSEVYSGPIEGWSTEVFNRLPTWLYSLTLLSSDRELELIFSFRSDEILSEEKLKSYISENADWSLAQEYIV